jgi:hypothetical protein
MSDLQTKLYIVIEGGCVQSVCSDDPAAFAGVEVVVIDYDTEGADAADITPVCQGDGTSEPAIVGRWGVDAATVEVR